MIKISSPTIRIPTLVFTQEMRTVMIGIVNLGSWSLASLSKYHIPGELQSQCHQQILEKHSGAVPFMFPFNWTAYLTQETNGS